MTQLVARAVESRIAPDFDCGFVACTFSSEQWARLADLGVEVRSVCRAIPDIAPSGEAWPCYALSQPYRTRIQPDESFEDVRQRLDRRLFGFRALGLYEECRSCRWFVEQTCRGGCASRIIKTFSTLGAS